MQNTNDYINSENTKRFKLQAPSSKRQAIQETVPHNDIEEAQAASLKHQAAEAPSRKLQAPSTKLQASSRKRQAHGPRTLDKVSRTSDQGA